MTQIARPERASLHQDAIDLLMVTSTTQRLPRLLVTVLAPTGAIIERHDLQPRPSLSIGRSNDCDLVLGDFGAKISRRHAMLMTEAGRWEFYNLGVNGSYKNGQRVDYLRLTDGTAVRLSKHGPILRFQLRQSSQQAIDPEKSDITDLMQQLRAGDEDASLLLWQRYADRIAEVARRAMQHSSSRVTDEEDIAIISFKSLLAGIRSGRFPEIDHREQLWRLMMIITTRKAAAALERDRRQKRGSGAVRGDSAVDMQTTRRDPESVRDDSELVKARADSDLPEGFDRLEATSTTPDIAALMADEAESLMQQLPDDISRQLVCLKLDGHTHEEIAEKLNCNVRTVERRLKQVRDVWSRRHSVLED